MNSKVLKAAIAVCGVVLALVATLKVSLIGSHANADERSIVGTWRTTIVRRSCESGAPEATFQGVLTFNSGGTLIGDSTVVGPAIKSVSYGVWQREHGWNDNSFSFMFYRFNSDGTVAGSQVVRQSLTLSESGEQFTTTGNFEVLDLNDVPIASACATSTGVRFK